MGKKTVSKQLDDLLNLPTVDKYSSANDAARLDAMIKKIDKTFNSMGSATRKAKGYEKGGSVNTKGFKYKVPNPNEVLLLNKMVTPSGKVVEVGKNSTVKKYKKGGAVMKGRGGSYKGCK